MFELSTMVLTNVATFGVVVEVTEVAVVVTDVDGV
jgi:hypothetical protein